LGLSFGYLPYLLIGSPFEFIFNFPEQAFSAVQLLLRIKMGLPNKIEDQY
jgi:hypothetical protein